MVNITPRLIYPQKIIPLPIEKEAGWAPEMDWKFWRRGKPIIPTRIPILDHLSSGPVAIPSYRNLDDARQI